MTLSAGDVFYLVNPRFPEVKAHPHIVVCVIRDCKIIYVYTSSKRNTVEKMCLRAEGKSDFTHLRTFVEIDPKECPALDCVSYVNANLSFMQDEYVITRLPTYDKRSGVASLPVLNRLSVAILSSHVTHPLIRSTILASLNPSKPTTPTP